MVLTDWVRGLSMRDYADRYFSETPVQAWNRVTQAVSHLRHRFAPAFERGYLAAEVNEVDNAPNVVLTLLDRVDERFLRDARRQLARMLRYPSVSLTLRVMHIDEHQREPMARLLEQLGKFGEQVSVQFGEQVRSKL